MDIRSMELFRVLKSDGLGNWEKIGKDVKTLRKAIEIAIGADVWCAVHGHDGREWINLGHVDSDGKVSEDLYRRAEVAEIATRWTKKTTS